MSTGPEYSGIALNVSRARLTVIGFMLTIDIFALGIFLRDVDRHLSLRILTDVSLFYGLFASLCIGTIAATLMLISERFDPLGNSDVGIFAFAEMTMFAAIVQTIGGIFNGFVTLFEVNLSPSGVSALGDFTEQSALIDSGAFFNLLVFWTVSLAWGFVVYLAPLWSVSRLPDTQRHKQIYFAYYLLLTVVLFGLFAYALHIEHLTQGESPGFLKLFLRSFWAPGMWGNQAGAT